MLDDQAELFDSRSGDSNQKHGAVFGNATLLFAGSGLQDRTGGRKQLAEFQSELHRGWLAWAEVEAIIGRLDVWVGWGLKPQPH